MVDEGEVSNLVQSCISEIMGDIEDDTEEEMLTFFNMEFADKIAEAFQNQNIRAWAYIHKHDAAVEHDEIEGVIHKFEFEVAGT
jgi:hypothetical protein